LQFARNNFGRHVCFVLIHTQQNKGLPLHYLHDSTKLRKLSIRNFTSNNYAKT
jgi:hypothetical protein